MGIPASKFVGERHKSIPTTAKMKLALIFLFAIFAFGTASPRASVNILKEVTSQDCDGTICAGGCCEGSYQWFCCPDGDTCALNPSYCSASPSIPQASPSIPQASPKVASIKTEVTSQDCDGTICAGGCCEGSYQWFCCPDGATCALNPS